MPATLSHRIITGLLRDQLGYKRLVLAGGLDSLAIERSLGTPQAARLATDAGADLLVIGDEISSAPAVLAALEDLPGYTLIDVLERIEFAKKRLHAPTKCSDEALELIEEDIQALRHHWSLSDCGEQSPLFSVRIVERRPGPSRAIRTP